MRLIDADALMQEFAEFVRDSNNSDFADVPTWNDAVSLLGSAPTIEERKKGEWIPIGVRHEWVCSNCKKEDVYAFSINETGDYEMQDFFCPNCGADMTRGEGHG